MMKQVRLPELLCDPAVAMPGSSPTTVKSPTARLTLGVLFTVAIILAYAGYTLHAVRRMREVQTDTIDRNRKASLQLIRIQGELNALALAMRDMLDNLDGYPLTAWSAQLNRMQESLENALRAEVALTGSRRDPQQTAYLASSFSRFWDALEAMQHTARSGQEAEARRAIRESLLPGQEGLSAQVARLLVANNEEEQRTALEVNGIYDGIERNAYIFLAASICVVGLVSLIVIRYNRSLFSRLSESSARRQELAWQLISTQETTFRAISRDLHDEFGQILTALGAMLRRAGRLAPDSEFRSQISETSEVVQETLEKIRALSQSLQPIILEEQGLAAAIQWYLITFERQTGIIIHYEASSILPSLNATAAVHVYRILQEALNNVARHAQVREATVRIRVDAERLELAVEDQGSGIPTTRKLGVGLTAMRERAELIGGLLSVNSSAGGGTTVRLALPLGRYA